MVTSPFTPGRASSMGGFGRSPACALDGDADLVAVGHHFFAAIP
jgi:hypothetical protein